MRAIRMCAGMSSCWPPLAAASSRSITAAQSALERFDDPTDPADPRALRTCRVRAHCCFARPLIRFRPGSWNSRALRTVPQYSLPALLRRDRPSSESTEEEESRRSRSSATAMSLPSDAL